MVPTKNPLLVKPTCSLCLSSTKNFWTNWARNLCQELICSPTPQFGLNPDTVGRIPTNNIKVKQKQHLSNIFYKLKVQPTLRDPTFSLSPWSLVWVGRFWSRGLRGLVVHVGSLPVILEHTNGLSTWRVVACTGDHYQGPVVALNPYKGLLPTRHSPLAKGGDAIYNTILKVLFLAGRGAPSLVHFLSLTNWSISQARQAHSTPTHWTIRPKSLSSGHVHFVSPKVI